MRAVARVVIVALVAPSVLILLRAEPANAWKPPTHLFGVEEALVQARAGNVNIPALSGASLNVPVNDTIRQALAVYPNAYRAGAVGPDAYPDLLFGQGQIHPDTRTHNDENPAGNEPRTSQTYEWFTHLWERAWDPATPQPQRLKNIAFALGYMGGHGNGDVWAHTYINKYAQGVFPDFTDLAHSDISVRHVIVEGYIDKHRPGRNDGGFYTLDAPLDFVTDELILSPFSRSHAKSPFFDFFLGMQDELRDQDAELDFDNTHQDDISCADVPGVGEVCIPDPTDSPINLVELAIDVLVDQYVEAWISDITDGMRAWAGVWQTIAQEFFAGKKVIDKDKIFAAFKSFVLLHLLSMMGLPDFVGGSIFLVSEVISFVTDLIITALDLIFETIKAVPILGDVVTFMEGLYDKTTAFINAQIDTIVDKLAAVFITAALGFTNLNPSVRDAIDHNNDGLVAPSEVIRVFEQPEEYINDPALFAPTTRAAIDAEMGVAAGSDDDVGDVFGEYNPLTFAPLRNTTTMAKLAMLDQDGLNAFFKARAGGNTAALGDLYGAHTSAGGWFVPNNIMLGWAKSIDAEYQWRTHSPNDGHSYGTGALRLFEDCVARDLVFRKTFAQPVTGVDAFADTGDQPSGLSDATAPVTVQTLSGPHITSGGTVYISGATQIVLTTTDNYWAKPDVRVFSRTFATGSSAPAYGAGVPADVAPFSLTGADGSYTVQFLGRDAKGVVGCNTEAEKTRLFSLDNTPPTITVTSPIPPKTEYLSDAILPLSFTASDGPGSGVDESTLRHFADGVEKTPIPTTIDLFDYPAGDHVYRAQASDKLGNAGSATVPWVTTVTFASYANNLSKALTRGCIDQRAYEILEAKRKTAAQYDLWNRDFESDTILAQMKFDIRARTERGITRYCADILITNATWLQTH